MFFPNISRFFQFSILLLINASFQKLKSWLQIDSARNPLVEQTFTTELQSDQVQIIQENKQSNLYHYFWYKFPRFEISREYHHHFSIKQHKYVHIGTIILSLLTNNIRILPFQRCSIRVAQPELTLPSSNANVLTLSDVLFYIIFNLLSSRNSR